ncbi:MAG: hypothetical protein M3H12_07710 [Chromatiales bacterium]|nr:hypothetical protein [Gammaproteobacteria bacterium]
MDQSFQRKLTNRGYTGHEQIDNIGLIHMNARLYDPEIGRFLSADSYIQEPGLSQNFNRYIYVMNNPLKYNDPSGHFINFIIGAIIMIVSQFIDNPYIRMIGMVVGMAMMGGAFFGEGLFTAAAGGSGASGSFVVATGNATANGIIAGALNGAAIGAVVGGATTGTLKGALKGAVFGGMMAASATAIGSGALGPLFENQEMASLAHGVTQGVISELRGGDFKSGFIGGFIAHMSPAANWAKANVVPMPIRTMTAAVFGGLASAATGGSFADGAYHAAMVHLFNAEMGKYHILNSRKDASDVLIYNQNRSEAYWVPSGAASQASSAAALNMNYSELDSAQGKQAMLVLSGTAGAISASAGLATASGVAMIFGTAAVILSPTPENVFDYGIGLMSRGLSGPAKDMMDAYSTTRDIEGFTGSLSGSDK